MWFDPFEPELAAEEGELAELMDEGAPLELTVSIWRLSLGIVIVMTISTARIMRPMTALCPD